MSRSKIPPPRTFEEYTLTRIVASDVGLFPVASRAMPNVLGAAGVGGDDDSASSYMRIGFDFSFDGSSYKTFVASPNGYIGLVDPTFDTSLKNPDAFLATMATSSYDNSTISSSFSTHSVLLCPWFDDLRNVYNNMSLIASPHAVSAADRARIDRGLELPPATYNKVNAGMRYVNTTDLSGRRCLVIRWSSLSNYTNPSSVLKFDVVLYEDGTFEFRYHTRSGILQNPIAGESATIGIFLNNDPTLHWRFRDFAVDVGYSTQREKYRLGGAVYNSAYSDTVGGNTVPYSVRLTPAMNWPGLNSQGGVFSFTPPVNRRQVLPRAVIRDRSSVITMPTIARTGDPDRLGTSLVPYDDRRAVAYVSGVVVNYPTTLQRFYANSEAGIVDRRDLFGDFEITGTISKAASDEFIGNASRKYVTPFNEQGRPEQGNSANPFFATGSSLSQLGMGLTYPLASKTQLKLTLPVEYPTQLFDVTSSIYYYNAGVRGWFVPQGTGGADLANPLAALSSFSFTEDGRGFGAFGNVLSSGSSPSPPATLNWQSDDVFGSAAPDAISGFHFDKQTTILTRMFSKSVQNNPEYVANASEQFTLPINQPFLIEKVVFELPVTMGDGWFKDRTTSGFPIIHNFVGIDNEVFDVAGPAITVALFNQVSSGPVTYRDLIVTGSIIPLGDSFGNVKVEQGRIASSNNPIWCFSPEGFQSYGLTPGCVVTPVSSSTVGLNFTGSVQVRCVAGISNGCVLSSFGNAATDLSSVTPSSASVIANRQQVIATLTNPGINVKSNSLVGNPHNVNYMLVKDVDTFGRSAKSFDPSGRSVFGKEFVTSQARSQGSVFANPLYVSSSYDQLPANMRAVIETGSFGAVLMTAVSLSTAFPSPYLVMPGDKLTLAISKMRPLLRTEGIDPLTGGQADYYTGSLRHDATMATGSIRITFYGSMLSAGVEKHETLNQPLASDAIHELVGYEPVIDQYDIDYKGTYYGSTTDDFVTGSMLTKQVVNGVTKLITGSRGRVFSIFQARDKAVPASSPTTDYEVVTNPSKAFRLQPWFEKVGAQRVVQCTSDFERFYDSMMPALNQCFDIDGSGIWRCSGNPGLEPSQDISVGLNVGYIFLNYQNPAFNSTPTLFTLCNGNWTWSYPFEPKYSAVSRQIAIERTFTSDILVDPTFSTVTRTSPTEVNVIYPVDAGNIHGSQGSAQSFNVWQDADLRTSTPSVHTGSMSNDDLVRTMFGFGDANTMIVETPTTFGGNHLPTFRDSSYVQGSGSYAQFGPVIRGWKYGVHSGLPAYSKIVFRRNKYGQFRDMLEQRPYAKYYQTAGSEGVRPGVLQGPVTVTFVDASNTPTLPENTWSQNLSAEVTSSFPYLDGQTRDRSPINVNTLNKSVVTLKTDALGNVTV